MSRQFTQATGSAAIETNKQSIARDFGVKQSEVCYFIPGDTLVGFKVIYNPETDRAYSLPSGITAGTTMTSLSIAAILVHSKGSVDLGALAVSRGEYVTLPGSFTSGATINVKNENLEYQGVLYRWKGTLPKVIPVNSTPASAGGTAADAWGSVEDGSQSRTLALTVQWRGSMPLSANINLYGPTDEYIGTWSQPSSAASGATIANGYPVSERGLLEIFKASRNNGMQRYTTDNGRIFVRNLNGTWNGTDGPWVDWLEVGSLSSNKALPETTSLSDAAAFSQNTTYVLAGARTDMPVGANTNAIIASWRRQGGNIVGLSQIVFTNIGVYERRGVPNLAAAWTSVNWYGGGDANGWRPMGMDAMRTIGIGVDVSPLIAAFDWQQADFIVGSLQVAQAGGFTNGPTEIVYNSTTSVTIETLQCRSNLWVVKLTPLTTSLGNKREYTVVINGVKGARTFQVTQNFTSDAPIPVEFGGTGGKTPFDGRKGLELNTRYIDDGKNINEIGPSLEGLWTKITSVSSTPENGYPEYDCVGVLEVFKGGAWAGMQRFTTRSNLVYIRSLTGSWNGTDGPWSPWASVYESSPLPDVWLPLTDSMRMVYGEGPYDRITIGNQYLELTSRSASFTRTTTGSYIDKRGVMQIAEINEPRFEKKGLLIESTTTNLYINSESFKGSTGSAVTNNSEKSLRGDTTMCLFQETAINGEHYLDDRFVTLTPDSIYTFSVYAKGGTGDRSVYVRVADNTGSGGTSSGAIFNPNTGTWSGSIVGKDAIDRGFEDLGNGIYRVWVVFKAVGGNVSNIRLQLAKNWTTIYDGDVTAGLYVWGAQLEENPLPTSYIKTEAAAATRSGDSWELSNANLGYVTLAQKFARTIAFNIAIKFSPPTNYTEILSSRGARNDIMCRIHQVSKETLMTAYRSSGGFPITMRNVNDEGVFTHRTNGDTVTTYFLGKTYTGTTPPVSTTETPTGIGNSSAGTFSKFCYHIRHLRIWHRALLDSQIKGLR